MDDVNVLIICPLLPCPILFSSFLPIFLSHTYQVSNAGEVMTYTSDDNGKTWKRGQSKHQIVVYRKLYTAQEPGVVELKDGSLMLWIRTNAGRQYVCRSTDRGETWSKPRPSALCSPMSPASIKRLPTGDLLAVWNDHALDSDFMKKIKPWARTPLAAAVSCDDGLTWSPSRLIEDDPDGWFCYVAIHPLDDGRIGPQSAEHRPSRNDREPER